MDTFVSHNTSIFTHTNIHSILTMSKPHQLHIFDYTFVSKSTEWLRYLQHFMEGGVDDDFTHKCYMNIFHDKQYHASCDFPMDIKISFKPTQNMPIKHRGILCEYKVPSCLKDEKIIFLNNVIALDYKLLNDWVQYILSNGINTLEMYKKKYSRLEINKIVYMALFETHMVVVHVLEPVKKKSGTVWMTEISVGQLEYTKKDQSFLQTEYGLDGWESIQLPDILSNQCSVCGKSMARCPTFY